MASAPKKLCMFHTSQIYSSGFQAILYFLHILLFLPWFEVASVCILSFKLLISGPYPLTHLPVDFMHFWSISSMILLISHSVPLFCNVSLPSPSLLYPLCLTTSLFILWMKSFFHMPFLSLVTASVGIVFVILTTIPLKASQNSWCSFQTSPLEKHVSRGMFKCGSYLINWLQVISL